MYVLWFGQAQTAHPCGLQRLDDSSMIAIVLLSTGYWASRKYALARMGYPDANSLMLAGAFATAKWLCPMCSITRAQLK